MKIFKKSLALTLAVLMLLTSMTITSFADGETTEDTSTEATFTPATKWLYLKTQSTENEKPIIAPYDGTDFNYVAWKNGANVNVTSTSATT